MVRTYLNGTEITNIVQGGTSSHWLNRKYQATATILVEDYDPGFFDDGARLKITGVSGYDSDIDFHGFVKFESAEDGEDADGTVEITAESPRELWEWRPARDGVASGDPGDFSKPDFLDRLGTGPQVMQEILTQSEGPGIPADAEGPTFIDLANSGFATGGADISGLPVDWPMTIEEIASLLTSTGEVDIVENFIDSGGNMVQLQVLNGNYGTDLSGSVSFDYATGAHNVKQINRTRDITKVCNKLWYYLGPKVSVQRWRRSIVGGAIMAANYEPPLSAILALRDASRAKYGVRMDIRVYDSEELPESSLAPLYERLWLDESMWRASPRTLLNVTPVDGLLPTFDVGDIIGIEAGARFLGGGSWGQRVYGRKVSWDADGVVSLAQITSSEDGDAV